MPALGHQGYLVGVKEVTWGTDPGNGYTAQSILNESLDTKQDHHFSSPIQGSRVAPTLKIPMGITVGGAINFEADVEGLLPLFLKGILSAEATVDHGAGNGGTHTFTPQNAISPSFTVIVGRDTTPDNANIWSYGGCKVDKLSLSAQEGGLLTAAVTLSAKTGVSSASAVTPSYTLENPLVYHTGAITIAGDSVAVKAFKLDIDSGNLIKRGELGSKYIQEQQPGLFKVTGEVTAYFDSMNQINDYLDSTDVAIILELDGTAVGTSTRKLILTVPTAQFTGETPKLTGAGNEIMLKLPFQAWLSSEGSPDVLVQADVTNSQRTAY